MDTDICTPIFICLAKYFGFTGVIKMAKKLPLPLTGDK